MTLSILIAKKNHYFLLRQHLFEWFIKWKVSIVICDWYNWFIDISFAYLSVSLLYQLLSLAKNGFWIEISLRNINNMSIRFTRMSSQSFKTSFFRSHNLWLIENCSVTCILPFSYHAFGKLQSRSNIFIHTYIDNIYKGWNEKVAKSIFHSFYLFFSTITHN